MKSLKRAETTSSAGPGGKGIAGNNTYGSNAEALSYGEREKDGAGTNGESTEYSLQL